MTSLATPALQLLPSGGVVHVEQPANPGSHPPILFLHGVGGGAWSFAPQREALRGEFSCFTWEGRGHGAAARVVDAGLGDYYRDACEALEHVLSIIGGRPPILVGHSMGGLIALALACERPEAVSGVFLIDPVYADRGEPPVTLPRLVLSLLRVVVGAIARSYLRDGWLGRAIARPMFRWAFHDRAAMARAWQLQRTQVPLEYPKMLYEAFEGVSNFPFQPFADRVAVPTHLVEAVAARGAVRSRFAAVMERLRRRLGDAASFETIRGGHYLQLDRPAAINEQLRTFVAGIERRSLPREE